VRFGPAAVEAEAGGIRGGAWGEADAHEMGRQGGVGTDHAEAGEAEAVDQLRRGAEREADDIARPQPQAGGVCGAGVDPAIELGIGDVAGGGGSVR